jgi:hypothetical protein
MKTIPLTPDTEALARRLVWFEDPEEALSDTFRFVAYAAARATHEDMKLVRLYLDDDDLREALDHAPPGIIDPAHGLTGIPSWNAIPRRLCRSADSDRAPSSAAAWIHSLRLGIDVARAAGHRFAGWRRALAKAPNGRRSSANTSGPFRSAARHVVRPSRAYLADRHQE